MEIVRYPADILRQKTVSVTEFDAALAALANDMISTMVEGRGIGLAAPQVGSLLSLFIAQEEEGKPLVFVNPEIIGTSLETVPYEEGCLSIPGMYEEVIRPEAVLIQAYNLKGRPFKKECSGLLARIVQHEADHLKGVLFIDYLSDMKRDRLLKQYQKNLKK
jgi:peptide deformylase